MRRIFPRRCLTFRRRRFWYSVRFLQIQLEEITESRDGSHMESQDLRTAIRECGLSVAEFARQTGVTPTTIYSFLSGQTQHLRSDTHSRVAAFFMKSGQAGADPAEIFKLYDRPVARVVEVRIPSELYARAQRKGLDVERILLAGGLKALHDAASDDTSAAA